ncbi:hypothetical protein [Mucilaginibacter aquaedulcis]|jgi:peroxiredoxin Q/BCP|uniref:hypothetical protein n=1 Tax=Mucilaginibacter aquaedulcis TaxID=1187081 RepID=UPI0025B39140|nr:hypothetical protein [Mucilaginibacter aquaedulcis]MDN3550892.1 hypothetical protein [Mucilaginibacter aquaedulcis]
MESDIRMIKYLLFILAASFVFSCVAEAQTNKRLTAAYMFPAHSLVAHKNIALHHPNHCLAL